MDYSKIVWITDSKKYVEQLKLINEVLPVQEVVLEQDCNIETLPGYDLVIFVLNPINIANKFFIGAIKEILKIRKSSKTIHFVINDSHLLTPQEIINVKLELKKCLEGIIENPEVSICSTYYSCYYEEYRKGNKCLEDIQKDPNFFILEEDGNIIVGKAIEIKQLEKLMKLSNITSLLKRIEIDRKSISELCIDVNKKNYLVVGPVNTGKSLFTETIRRIKGDVFEIKETNCLENLNTKLYDGIFVFIDTDFDKHRQFIEEVCSLTMTSKLTIIVNKIDDYMFFNMTSEELIKDITSKLMNYTDSKVLFLSSYYIKILLDLIENKVTINDIVKDNNIAFENMFGFPICKEKYIGQISQLLIQNSNYNNLLKCLEE